MPLEGRGFESHRLRQRAAGPNSSLGSAVFFTLAARPQTASFLLHLYTQKACNQADCRLFSYVIFQKQAVGAYRIFSLLNLDFAILPSTPEITAFGQSKPCFHRLCRGDLCMQIAPLATPPFEGWGSAVETAVKQQHRPRREPRQT